MTTTVATRRSVLYGLALAVMASFILISVSCGASAQQTRADALDDPDLALPNCGSTGQPECSVAELVLFSPYSNLDTADPDPEAGYQFYGESAVKVCDKAAANVGFGTADPDPDEGCQFYDDLDLALPNCGSTGQPECSAAELVLFSPYSNLDTADPDPEARCQFYGESAVKVCDKAAANVCYAR